MRYRANQTYSIHWIEDTETGRPVDYANSEEHAIELAAEWNRCNGRPPLPAMPDCSWLNDSDMNTAILTRPARKTEKCRGISV